MSIGRFSTLVGITARALRHYEAVGVLRPAAVDPATGYRYYDSSQIPLARTIGEWRDLGLSLDDIRTVLASSDRDTSLREVLSRRRALLSGLSASSREQLSRVEQRLADRPRSNEQREVSLVGVEPTAVLSWRERHNADEGPSTDVSAWIEADRAIADVGGRTTHSIGIGHAFDVDGVIELELGYVTTALLPSLGRFTTRVLDGGLFVSAVAETWADKAAVYNAIDEWMTHRRLQRRGPARELGPIVAGARSASSEATLVMPTEAGWSTTVLVPVTED